VEQLLEGFLNERLRGPEADLTEVIVVGIAVGEEVPYTHAVTVLAIPKTDSLLISDPAADTLACWPAKPPGYADKPLFKLRDLTNEYVVLTLFHIKSEALSKERQQQLERELCFIMTGKE